MFLSAQSVSQRMRRFGTDGKERHPFRSGKGSRNRRGINRTRRHRRFRGGPCVRVVSLRKPGAFSGGIEVLRFGDAEVFLRGDVCRGESCGGFGLARLARLGKRLYENAPPRLFSAEKQPSGVSLTATRSSCWLRPEESPVSSVHGERGVIWLCPFEGCGFGEERRGPTALWRSR
jgi:hypothetical protein